MTRLTSLTSVLALVAGGAIAQETHFNRVASFATPSNMAEGEDLSRESSAEIITVSEDGMTLVYSDSPLGVIGIVDITDPANPVGRGNIALDGEPTAVSALGKYRDVSSVTGLGICSISTSRRARRWRTAIWGASRIPRR